MEISKRTKSIDILYPLNFRSLSMIELQMCQTILNQLKDGLNVTCYALNEDGDIHVYLDDDNLFCTILDIKAKVLTKRILEKENIIVGAICADKDYVSNHNLLIKFYYDYISGNHNDDDITRLWLRDITAQLHYTSVPKAKYIGTGSMEDVVGKDSSGFRFVDTHFIYDTIDIELDEEVYMQIVNIIDPNQNGMMTNNLNVIARIPSWASQAAYYVVGQSEPIWLAPSYHPYILDQVHQNGSSQGRVVSYRDNYDGTYHFELKFHIEK